jgi:uncharacterized Fe-S cluster protein YjdI
MTDTPPGRAYTGQDITVYYDIERCVHFAECVRGLPEVFDTQRKPWITAGAASADRVAEVVRRCPSGALHYLWSGPDEAPESPTRIEATGWGPVTVRGDLRVAGPNGDTSAETRVALCGCGRSAHAPRCDNTCRA